MRWPARSKGGGAHQIVRDDAQSDPTVHAVFTMVATARESMSTFEHTNPAFTADAPPLAATKPALAFIYSARGRFRTSPRKDHTPDTASSRRVFIHRRTEAAIGRGKVRGAAGNGLMAIQRPRPQGHVRRSAGMHLVRRDDLMFRFLNGEP